MKLIYQNRRAKNSPNANATVALDDAAIERGILNAELRANGIPSAIKVGDSLICVDDGASFNRLTKGATYKAVAAYDGTPTVIVRGAMHSLSRFVKAPAAI